MTVQEIQTMIRQNMVLYRNVAKPLTDKEADLLIATWADALSDVPSAAGKLAFRRALRVCHFPVLIADLYDQLRAMRSFPLQKQSEQAFTDWADDQTSGKYSQAIDNGVLPALVPTLDKYAEQAPLAAMGGAMAGKMAQYNAFNQLVDGTGYADAAQKAGGKLYDAAKKIPVLNRIVQPGFGEAAGRVLADTGADFVLDTYPSMMDDMDKFSADRQTAARGENVDDPMTVGRMAANAAKNLAGNVAMNALPEIGSAVLNGAKNSFSGAMLDEPLQEAAAVAGKSSRLDTRPDLPRADTPAAVDLEKNADAFLRDANSADAVKSVPDSTAANFTSTPQNAAQGLADSAADAPGVAVRERGYAASLRTNSDLPDAEIQAFKNIPAGDGSFNKSDLVNALNYMNLTNEERRAYFSIVAPTWKNPY